LLLKSQIKSNQRANTTENNVKQPVDSLKIKGVHVNADGSDIHQPVNNMKIKGIHVNTNNNYTQQPVNELQINVDEHVNTKVTSDQITPNHYENQFQDSEENFLKNTPSIPNPRYKQMPKLIRDCVDVFIDIREGDVFLREQFQC